MAQLTGFHLPLHCGKVGGKEMVQIATSERHGGNAGGGSGGQIGRLIAHQQAVFTLHGPLRHQIIQHPRRGFAP